ncbi:MAG: YrhK family protein [Pseudomonadota bacterium]
MKRLFHVDHRAGGADKQRVYAIYELIYTVVDFLAAALFVVGSIMFFSEDWTYFGTWLFLIGSIMFGLKPALRLSREWQLMRMGETDELAERFKK